MSDLMTPITTLSFTVTNYTDCDEVVTFEDEAEAREFAADTNGVLTLPNGKMISYENGEPEESVIS